MSCIHKVYIYFLYMCVKVFSLDAGYFQTCSTGFKKKKIVTKVATLETRT